MSSAAAKRTAPAGSETPRRLSSRLGSTRNTPEQASSAATSSSDQPTVGSPSSSATGGLQSQRAQSPTPRRSSPRLSQAGPSPILSRNVSPAPALSKTASPSTCRPQPVPSRHHADGFAPSVADQCCRAATAPLRWPLSRHAGSGEGRSLQWSRLCARDRPTGKVHAADPRHEGAACAGRRWQ